MIYLAGQITVSLVAAALLGGMVGWTLRGDMVRRKSQPIEISDQAQ